MSDEGRAPLSTRSACVDPRILHTTLVTLQPTGPRQSKALTTFRTATRTSSMVSPSMDLTRPGLTNSPQPVSTSAAFTVCSRISMPSTISPDG